MAKVKPMEPAWLEAYAKAEPTLTKRKRKKSKMLWKSITMQAIRMQMN